MVDNHRCQNATERTLRPMPTARDLVRVLLRRAVPASGGGVAVCVQQSRQRCVSRGRSPEGGRRQRFDTVWSIHLASTSTAVPACRCADFNTTGTCEGAHATAKRARSTARPPCFGNTSFDCPPTRRRMSRPRHPAQSHTGTRSLEPTESVSAVRSPTALLLSRQRHPTTVPTVSVRSARMVRDAASRDRSIRSVCSTPSGAVSDADCRAP